MADFAPRVAALDLAALTFIERRTWELDCNWKVYVDNYLDGGYHVPHLHRDLDTVIDYASYEIEIGQRAQQQRFARPRRSRQGQAFAGVNMK